MKPKTKEVIPIHPKQKIEWKILPGRRRMNITPWIIGKCDVVKLKKLIKND